MLYKYQWEKRGEDFKLKGVNIQYVGEWDFKLTFDHDALEDQVIAFSKVPIENRPGVARRFLAASAMWCTVGGLYSLLKAKGVIVSDITARSEVQMGKDESGQNVVESVNLEVTVDVPEENIEDLEHCWRVWEKRCFIRRSLERGVKIVRSMSIKG